MKSGLIFALSVLGAGCASSWHARPIASMPVATGERVVPTEARIAVESFVDGRGASFESGSGHNPFFRQASVSYPEDAGLLRDRGHVMAVGSLDTALPVLLARTMEQMALSPSVAVGGAPADYVVTGKLVRAELNTRKSPIAARVVGLLGIPFASERVDLEYEIWVADARDPSHPIFHRGYTYGERSLVGLYYGHHAAYDLLRRGLDATLPQVVRDIAAVVHAVPTIGSRGPTPSSAS